MWKRTLKGKFGEVTNVTSSNQPWFAATETPVYDAIPGIKYTVESLSKANAESAEKANLRGNPHDPWEFRDSYETDSLGLFISEICVRMLDPNTANCWAFLETESRDTCAEIPSTLKYTLRQLIDSEINHKLNSMTETISAMETELSIYQEFIKKYNAENIFRKFKEEL